MKKLLSKIIKHSNIMLAFILAITAVMGFFALKISFDPNFYCIFPENNKRSITLTEETGITETLNMAMLLSVHADDAISIDKLKLLYEFICKIENNKYVKNCITPFNFITFQNKNKRLSIEKIASKPPQTQQELEDFRNRLLNEKLARGNVVADGGKTLNIFITNTSIDEPAEFIKNFEDLLKPLEGHFEISYTGDAAFSDHTATYLQRDLFVLVILAAIVILFVLYISFRAFRAVFLPFLTVAIGAIWTIGFSALIGFKLTVVSVVLPIIILAIGSSYTVHILSEYFRVYNGDDKETGIGIAVSHVVKTVIFAGLTTIIGFCSLLFTSIRPLREFGLSVSFGILSCVILSILFLPTLLSKFSPPRKEHKKIFQSDKDILKQIIHSLSRFVEKFYIFLFILFFIIIVIAYFVFPEIKRKVDYVDYFPSSDELVEDTYKLIETSGGGQYYNITIKAPTASKNYFIQDEVVEKMINLERQLLSLDDVIDVTSYYSIMSEINYVMNGDNSFPASKGLVMLLSRYFKLLEDSENVLTYGADADFINKDNSQISLFLKVYNSKTGGILAAEDVKNLIDKIESTIQPYIEDDAKSYHWGNSVINYDGAVQVQRDQISSTIISMVLIFIVAAIVFKSAKLGLFSIVPLVFAISFNYILMVIFNIPLDLTTVLVSNVAIGVGVDDAIHFILQYMHQIELLENNKKEAVRQTFFIAGRPIILTTVSIVAGFLVLGMASFKPIIFFGILVSMSLLAAMLATLIFLPSFILVLNKIKLIFLKK